MNTKKLKLNAKVNKRVKVVEEVEEIEEEIEEELREAPHVRSFFIGRTIDDELVQDFHDFIKNDLIYKQVDPIYVYINSGGGILSCSLTIMEFIRNCKTEVIVITVGSCYSGAVLAQIVGDKRYCYRTASFLIHPIQTMMIGASNDIEDELNQLAVDRSTTYELFSKYTNCTDEFLEKVEQMKKNFYLTAEEAKNFGLIDKILK